MNPIIHVVGLALAGIFFLQGAVMGHLQMVRGAHTSPITNWGRLICLLLAACLGGLAVLVFF